MGVVSAGRLKEAEGCLDATAHSRVRSVMIDAPFDYFYSEQAGEPRGELDRHSARSAAALLVSSPPPQVLDTLILSGFGTPGSSRRYCWSGHGSTDLA